jgi:hypothetical protein
MNAPESDIDAYIASEGLAVEAIKNFKEQPQQQSSDPTDLMRQAIQERESGHPVAGAINAFGRVPINVGFKAMGAVNEQVRQGGVYPFNQIPGAKQYGGVIAGVNDFIGSAFGKAGEFVRDQMLPGNNTVRIPNLFSGSIDIPIPESLTPEYNATRGLLGDVATIATGKLAGMGAKGVVGAPEFLKNKAGTVADVLEKKAIQPPFDPKKGIQVFDRPAKTNLEFDFAPNRKGYNQLSSGLDKLDGEAKSVGSTSTATVDLKRLDQVIDTEIAGLKNSARATEVTAALEDLRDRVNEVAFQYPMGNAPVSAAIELKRSLQDIASGKYDEVATPKAEGAKILAHELLDDIIQQEPALKENGLKQQKLIELQGVLGRRVANLEKTPRGFVSWKNTRALGIGFGVGASTGNPILGFGAGALEAASENPVIQHRTAVFLNRLSGGRKVKP